MVLANRFVDPTNNNHRKLFYFIYVPTVYRYLLNPFILFAKILFFMFVGLCRPLLRGWGLVHHEEALARQ